MAKDTNKELEINNKIKPFFTISDELNEGKTLKAYVHDENEYGEIDIHSHDFYEINVVLSGEGLHTLGEYTYPVSGGEIYVIPPLVNHGYSFLDGGKVFHLLLSDEFLDGYEDVLSRAKGFNILFDIEPSLRGKRGVYVSAKLSEDKTDELEYLISKLITINGVNGDLASELHALSLITLLSTEATKSGVKETVLSVSAAVSALDYVADNYGSKITLDDLTKVAKLSRTALIDEFKKLTDLTPNEYVLKYRLTTAKNYLATTNKKIVEVALSCGFFDSAHFCKEFKRAFKITPKEFRERYR
ncbi:MAG: helix-turn-helix transcriptional regulator [Clostridia bacterium]|nr:helix-turn-helix transcriptional regulator [Clostridia bacterium]